MKCELISCATESYKLELFVASAAIISGNNWGEQYGYLFTKAFEDSFKKCRRVNWDNI